MPKIHPDSEFEKFLNLSEEDDINTIFTKYKAFPNNATFYTYLAALGYKEGKMMKTIMKTLLVSIASLSLMLSAQAGELTVSGSAKATYNASSGDNTDNGIGVTNELNFTASGEMDNGYS